MQSTCRFLARSATATFTRGFYHVKLDYFRSLLTTVVHKQVFHLSCPRTQQLWRVGNQHLPWHSYDIILRVILSKKCNICVCHTVYRNISTGNLMYICGWKRKSFNTHILPCCSNTKKLNMSNNTTKHRQQLSPALISCGIMTQRHQFSVKFPSSCGLFYVVMLRQGRNNWF